MKFKNTLWFSIACFALLLAIEYRLDMPNSAIAVFLRSLTFTILFTYGLGGLTETASAILRRNQTKHGFFIFYFAALCLIITFLIAAPIIAVALEDPVLAYNIARGSIASIITVLLLISF